MKLGGEKKIQKNKREQGKDLAIDNTFIYRCHCKGILSWGLLKENPVRRFVKCPKDTARINEGCGYWRWIDEI